MVQTSILINNYNNGRYLRACVNSALEQTTPADEVIVYDDGSNDDSLDILRSYESRIRLIEGKRTTLPSRAAQARAVAEAFTQSTGELVFLLDGDDCFHNRKVAAYLEAYKAEPNASLIQSPMREIDPNGVPSGCNRRSFKHQADYLTATYQVQDVDFYYPTSSLAFARCYLKKVLPLDYSHDVELAVDTRLSSLAPLFGKVMCLDEVLSDWRRHPNSCTVLARRKTIQIKEAISRTRCFNRFCRQHGFKEIQLWRNRRFYLQVLRVAAPAFVFSLYYNHLRRQAADDSAAN